MSLALFLNSIVIGLSIAAPVGPIGLLVIRRTLNEGRLSGFITGLGAAAADAVYGAVGAFGLSVVSAMLVDSGAWLHRVGGLFLLALGIRTYLARPATAEAAMSGATRLAAFATTFALTLSNPLTILSFAAVFAGLGLAADARDPLAASTVVAGVFLGSALWWLALSGGVALFRRRVTPGTMTVINRLSGAFILAFGVAVLLGAR